jgi:hypothetical protein
MDPYERADVTSNTYYEYSMERAFLVVPTQAVVSQFIGTFKDFPPRQKPSSFSVDDIMEVLNEAHGRLRARRGTPPSRTRAAFVREPLHRPRSSADETNRPRQMKCGPGCPVEAVIWDMPTVTQSGLCGVERLAIDAQHINRLDFIFRLNIRAGLTPSPTNG